MMKIIRHMDLGRGNETPKSLRWKKETSIVAMITWILVFTISFIVPAQNPQIIDVYGVALDGQQITINGSNFGADGPNVVLFDDFKRGLDGANISLTPPVGNWNATNYSPTYGKDSQGNIAGRFIGDGGGRLIAEFSDVQEVYISYRIIIPPGEYFPFANAPNTFSLGSNWKLVWLMDGERGFAGNDDICLPTYNTTNTFTIGGNDNAFQKNVGNVGTSTHWFSFLSWNRFSVYLKGGGNPTVDSGKVWAQGMSEEFGQKIFEDSPVIFDGDDSPDSYKFSDDDISRWNRLNVPGWYREGSVNVGAMYDDIYIATGANSRARIEIGNNNLYQDCTKLAILTPISWQDNVIKATVRQGIFQDGETAYLFVIDKNGNTSNGYPLSGVITHVSAIDKANNSIALYPNPTTEKITIEIPEGGKGVTYLLYSITGQKVKQGKFINATNTVSLEGVYPGIYFLQVTSTQETEIISILKQ